jgi:hypothetical protein
MRAARVQPLAGLREKRLERRRPAARTGYAFSYLSLANRPISLTQLPTTHSVVDYEGKLPPNADRTGRAFFYGGCLSAISVCATVA